jgi:hypothetical protein
MAHRQTWSLSQDAHKSSGVCSSCHAVRQLHIKDGTIHRHGPRSKPCDGSDKPPLFIQSAPLTQVSTNTSTMPSVSSNQASTVIASSMSTTSTSLPVFTHPLPPRNGLIKHIPKSARPACATHLSSSLNSI